MKILFALFSMAAAAVLAVGAPVESTLPASQSTPGALDLSLAHETRAALDRGTAWLAARQNPDGSWGEPGRPELTALGRLAFLAYPAPAHADTRRRAGEWLRRLEAGGPGRRAALVLWALHDAPAGDPILLRWRDALAAAPLPEDAGDIALLLAAHQATAGLDPRPNAGRPSPDAPGAVRRLADRPLDSAALAGARLLAFHAAARPDRQPDVEPTLDWLGRNPGAFASPPIREEDFASLFHLCMGLAVHGKNRLAGADGRLFAWRPLAARALINAQRTAPDGTLYWAPREGEDPAAAIESTAHALLALHILLAE